MYMGVHRKEQKLKEAVRLRPFDVLLTKKRGFSLQGTMNCGQVTKKHVGELIGNESYDNKACLQSFSWCPSAVFEPCSPLLGTGGRRDLPRRGVYIQLLGR